MNGVLNIYKEKGFTSHDVVAKLRRILKTKKIGHTGTLDPNAEGVLPICVGQATKISELLMEKDKTYQVEFQLGITTDTQDIWGNVIEKKEVSLSVDAVYLTAMRFVGKQIQLPPMYSALKVNGKKLYELAREGIEVERKGREISIYSIEDFAPVGMNTYKMTVSCSKGTYIRTLCHDIGVELGCGATMTSLIRTISGKFKVKDSITLSRIEELVEQGKLMPHLLAVEDSFDMDKILVAQEFQKWLYAGNPIPIERTKLVYSAQNTMKFHDKELVFVYDFRKKPVGIYQRESSEYKVLKFLTSEENR